MLDNSIQVSEKTIIVDPKEGEAQAAVIWLHGLGADGNDFLGVLPELGLPEDHRIRFIFPNAPVQAVTVNGGMEMRSWYDIRSMDFLEDFDAAGVRVSTLRISDLVDQQLKQGILPERIVLAGFSQGGVIALHCGLSYHHRLAGVIALSTYCPMSEQFYLHRDMPILMMHGIQDGVIPFKIGEQSREALTSRGYQLEWHAYPMEHQVILPQLKTIGQWILRQLQD